MPALNGFSRVPSEFLWRQIALLYARQGAVIAKRFNRRAQVLHQLGGALLRASQVEVRSAHDRAHAQCMFRHFRPDVSTLRDTVEPGIDATFQEHLRGVVANGQGVDLLVAEALFTEDFLLRTA